MESDPAAGVRWCRQQARAQGVSAAAARLNRAMHMAMLTATGAAFGHVEEGRPGAQNGAHCSVVLAVEDIRDLRACFGFACAGEWHRRNSSSCDNGIGIMLLGKGCVDIEECISFLLPQLVLRLVVVFVFVLHGGDVGTGGVGASGQCGDDMEAGALERLRNVEEEALVPVQRVAIMTTGLVLFVIMICLEPLRKAVSGLWQVLKQ